MTEQLRQLAPALVSVEEAARISGIGRTHAWGLVTRGALPAVRIGKSRRVAVADIDAYVSQLRGEQAA